MEGQWKGSGRGKERQWKDNGKGSGRTAGGQGKDGIQTSLSAASLATRTFESNINDAAIVAHERGERAVLYSGDCGSICTSTPFSLRASHGKTLLLAVGKTVLLLTPPVYPY